MGVDFYSGGSQAPSGDDFVEPTPPDENYILKLNFYELSSMMQEILLLPGGIPSTPVTANTDPVGFIQDQSKQSIYVRAIGSTSRPLVSANGLVFDNTNDQLTVIAPTTYFKDLHAASPVWGMRFKITKGVDASAKTIIATGTGGTTGFGVFIQLTAANKILVQLCRGTSGTPMVNYATTRSITVASGRTAIQININGTGANACSIRMREADGTVTTETFTILSGVDANASTALSIGGALNATMSHSLDIINRVWTSQEMLDYEASTPANTTTHFTPIKQHEYDLDDTTTVFSDAAGTVPITDGTQVRLVTNKVVPIYPYKRTRNMTGVDGTGLLWEEDVQNGNGGVIADGSGDRLLTFGEDVLIEAAAVSTLFMVARNTDPDFGSQWMNGGGTYGVFTGKDYSGNLGGTGDAAQPYFLNHPTVSVTNPVLISRTDSYNIIAMRRFGSTIDLWAQNGTKVTTSGLVGACGFQLIGQSTANGVPQFHPQGSFAYLLKYAGYLSDDQVVAKIAELRTRYNIPASVA